MTKRPLSHRVCFAFTVITLCAIFIQSLLPPSVSGAQSGWVATFLGRIFGEESALGAFLVTYVRKIAHVTEYATLGLLVCATARCYLSNASVCLTFLLPLSGFAVGFIDESLQILSHRGPAIADVWLDGGGFLIGYFFLTLLLRLLRRKCCE